MRRKTDIINDLFIQIVEIDKSSKNGSINVIEFTQQHYIFIGYENGTIIAAFYNTENNKILALTNGYNLDPEAEEPIIILSIFPIFLEPEGKFNLIVGSYTRDIHILSHCLKEDVTTESLIEKTKKKKQKLRNNLGIISVVSVIKDAQLKPGI